MQQSESSEARLPADVLMDQVRAQLRSRNAPAGAECEGRRTRADESGTRLTTEEIMARVQAELARQGARNAADAGAGVPLPASPVQSISEARTWHPVAPPLVDKQQYALADFLCFRDEDFVETAYRKLLQRPPDPDGSGSYLGALRSGVISKVEVLGSLRFSKEGRARAVHVDGLLLPYKFHQWRRRRFIGWFIGMGIALVRLPRLALRLQGIEASAAYETHELGRTLNLNAAALDKQAVEVRAQSEALRSDVTRSLLSQVDGLRNLVARLEKQDAALGHLDETLRKDISARIAKVDDALHVASESHQSEFDKLSQGLAAQGTVVDRIGEQALRDQRSVRAMLERLTVFLDTALRKPIGNEPDLAAREGSVWATDATPRHDYAAFEAVFRGPRDEIKARASHYLGTLAAACIRPHTGELVVDLGSGRGEWLEVLKEHGYRGRGVDTDKSMLQASRDRGDDVVEAAALDYLRTVDAGSVSAITSMHMVEHIPHPVLLQLLDEAMRVLRPGGVLILETPNPENVLVGSCMFYMDPTHLHPIPPALLQWVVHSRGFGSVDVERLSEHRGSNDLHPVSNDIPGAAQINQMISWFTAAPDYAIVARKQSRVDGDS